MSAYALFIFVGVSVFLIAAAIVWGIVRGVRRIWHRWSPYLRVTCENTTERGFVIRVVTGSRDVRVTRYGLGAGCRDDYEDFALHEETLIASDGRQETVIPVPAHAAVRLKPAVRVEDALFPSGAKAIENRMRVRPFVQIEGRSKPYRGAWCTFNLRREHVVRSIAGGW